MGYFTMQKFMDQYFQCIAGAILVGIVLVTIYGFSHTRDLLPPLCATDDHGKCFREWVSATGAWFALIAAYVTVRKMNEQLKAIRKQIDDANRHHEQNVRIQMMGRVAVVQRARARATSAQSACTTMQMCLETAGIMTLSSAAKRQMQMIADSLDEIVAIVNGPEMENFRDIRPDSFPKTVDFLIRDINEAKTRVTDVITELPDGEEWLSQPVNLLFPIARVQLKLNKVKTMANLYFGEVSQAADAFLMEWKALD